MRSTFAEIIVSYTHEFTQVDSREWYTRFRRMLSCRQRLWLCITRERSWGPKYIWWWWVHAWSQSGDMLQMRWRTTRYEHTHRRSRWNVHWKWDAHSDVWSSFLGSHVYESITSSSIYMLDRICIRFRIHFSK